MSDHPLLAEAERVRAELSARISQLADRRLQELAAEFRQRFPKRRLLMDFGMGTCAVQIDDYFLFFYEQERYDELTPYGRKIGWMAQLKNYERSRNLPADGLWFIKQAQEDVEEITDGYSDGCPDRLVVEPVR